MPQRYTLISLIFCTLAPVWAQRAEDSSCASNEVLITALRQGDDSVRLPAVYCANSRGMAPNEALPYLLHGLDDPNPRVRAAFSGLLGQYRPLPIQAIPGLCRLAKDTDENVRNRVVNTLAYAEPVYGETVEALRLLAQDPVRLISGRAAFILNSWGDRINSPPKLPASAYQLPPKPARPQNLAAVSPPPESLTALIAKLKDSQAAVRASAARSLGSRGAQAKEAAPALIAMLGDRETWVRGIAAEALGQIGPSATEAIPQLIALLKNQPASGIQNTTLLYALGQMGPAAEAAIPDLAKALDGPDGPTAAQALARIGPKSIPALSRALSDPNPRKRVTAALGFRLMGINARPAAPLLLQALKQEDREATDQTAATEILSALYEIRPDSRAVPSLIEFLKSTDRRLQIHALNVLGTMGLEGRTAVPSIVPFLRDEDPYFQRSAARVLTNIGSPEAKSALQGLR